MTRVAKTPTQRATETLLVLQRRLDRIHAAQQKGATALAELGLEESQVKARYNHAAANPDLSEHDQ